MKMGGEMTTKNLFVKNVENKEIWAECWHCHYIRRMKYLSTNLDDYYSCLGCKAINCGKTMKVIVTFIKDEKQ